MWSELKAAGVKEKASGRMKKAHPTASSAVIGRKALALGIAPAIAKSKKAAENILMCKGSRWGVTTVSVNVYLD